LLGRRYRRPATAEKKKDDIRERVEGPAWVSIPRLGFHVRKGGYETTIRKTEVNYE